MVHHGGHDLMATDDEVAPRVRRFRAGQIVATGLAIMVIALVGILWGLDRKAQLSIEDRQQIHAIIQERKVQRDRQQAQVDLQLQQQARVLCTVVLDFQQTARTARGRASLARAMQQLDCARVLRIPPKGNR
jgi:uncharacterized membrane-anchored protein YhcB (DUF1043 family)